MKPELLPCPLCGGGAELWKAHEAHPPRKAWIACMDRCCAFITQEHMTDAEAVAAWNQRAEPKPDEALVEVEAALKEYLGKQCGMVLQKHALAGLARAAILALKEQQP